MFKGIVWLAKIVAAGLIISFLSIWTTGYIVTSYVESLLEQYEIPLDVPPMAMSGMWGQLWGSSHAQPPDETETAGEKATGLPKREEDNAVVFAQEEEWGEWANEEEDVGENTYSSHAENDRKFEELEANSDTTLSLSDGMSQQDMGRIFQMLASQIPNDVMSLIAQYTENGLTVEELNDVQTILEGYLERAQYEELMDILKKY